MPPKGASTGGQNPEFILREFQGMNVIDGREAISDDEFAWCENVIPIASAQALPVHGPALLITIAGETGCPSYIQTFNVAGTDFSFAVWAITGNGWIVNMTTLIATKIITGLSSGKTAATQYSNQGLLIVDPFSGYFDWNITTANTLSSQNNTLANATLIFSNRIPGGTQLKNTGVTAGGPGSGATVQTTWQVVLVSVLAAGTGYQVGDSLTLTDGSPTTPAQLIVSSIGGGGTITGVTLATGGSYPGPPTSTLVAVGPTGTVVTGGSGSTATFTVTISTLGINILTRGSGYSGAPFYQDLISTNVAQNRFNFTSSGVIGGTSIATYAGRVWIGLGRVVFFTDINSYNSFGGAGGSFTINDSYLHNNITALFAANNYLYIFGDTSIDALSNVNIALGVTSFSRINITASVGTITPTSIFAYYRAIVFYHTSGFYLLSGATPEKISNKISGIVKNIVVVGVSFSTPLAWGAQVLIQGELCATLLFSFTDTFTQGGAVRTLFALYFRGRWWVASWPGLQAQSMFSISVAGNEMMYGWVGNGLYQAFNAGSPFSAWLLKTKLWDAGSPLTEKQSLTAAFAGVFSGLGSTGVSINVDTELGTFATAPVTLAGNPTTYALLPTAANAGAPSGAQYLGLTVTGSTDVTEIHLLALRGKADRDLMR